MIMTTTGLIDSQQLGLTLSHEHIKWEYDDTVAHELYFDKKHDTVKMNEHFETLLPTFKQLYERGCRCVVDTSPPIGGPDLKLYNKLAEASGVNIIACTGWNTFRQIYKLFPEGYVEQLAKRWVLDYEEGMMDGLRPGYIKLLLKKGAFIAEDDKAMLEAAVIASNKTGMPIHCHILEASMVHQAVELLEELGFDLSKFLWAHADKESNLEVIDYAYSKGIWIGIDMIQRSNYEDKASLLYEAIFRGYDDRILLSQDVDFYECATSDDKENVVVLFDKFIPKCQEIGVEEDKIRQMMTINPAQYYQIRK